MVRVSLACTLALAFVALLPSLGASADPVEQDAGAQRADHKEGESEETADGELTKTRPVLEAIHGGHAPVIHPDAPNAVASPEGSQADPVATRADSPSDGSGAAAEEAAVARAAAAAAAPESTDATGNEPATPAAAPDSQADPVDSGAPDSSAPPPAAASTGNEVPAAASTGDGVPAAASTGDEVPAAASTGDEVPAAASNGDGVPAAASNGDEVPAAASNGDGVSAADAPRRRVLAAEPAAAPAAAVASDDAMVPVAPAAVQPEDAARASQEHSEPEDARAEEEADPPAADPNPAGGQGHQQSSDKAAPQHDVERPGAADAAFQPSNLLTLPMAAGETVSLFEEIGPDREGWVVRGGFAVASSGDATATVRVQGSWGQTLWEGRGRQSGTWKFKAQRGTLEIQLTNSNPGPAVLTLGWLVGGDKDNAFAQQRDRGEAPAGSAVPAGVESGPRISALMDSMSRATAAVHASMDAAQARMQTNAVWMRHNHQTAESTEWRINVWKGTEAVAVLALAVLQVWFISSVARTSLASFEDPRRRTHKVMSSRFAPRGMV